MKRTITDEVKKVFRPEFLNRIDEIVVFHSLTKDDMENILKLMLARVIKRVKEQKIDIEISKEAKELLLKKGFDLQYGARPLRRAIQRNLEDPLAEEILSKKIKEGQKITVYNEVYEEMIAEDSEIIEKKKKVKKVKAKVCKTC